MENGVPNFEEWANYCLTRGYADFHAGLVEEPDRFDRIPGPVTAEYLIRFLREADVLTAGLTERQFGDAVWYIFGVGGMVFARAQGASVPLDRRIECYRALLRLYTGPFDARCGRQGEDPDGKYSDTDPLDMAVYMMWDMGGGLGSAAMFPNEREPALVDAAWECLRMILRRCSAAACQQSALHGLGHLALYHQERAAGIIDEYLKARRPPGWLVEYAQAARTGCVQ